MFMQYDLALHFSQHMFDVEQRDNYHMFLCCSVSFWRLFTLSNPISNDQCPSESSWSLYSSRHIISESWNDSPPHSFCYLRLWFFPEAWFLESFHQHWFHVLPGTGWDILRLPSIVRKYDCLVLIFVFVQLKLSTVFWYHVHLLEVFNHFL